MTVLLIREARAHAVRRFLALSILPLGCAGADGQDRIRDYRPSAGLERLESEALHGDDIGLVQDFDMTDDTIFLLDRTGRVVLVERRGAALTLVGAFGRRGGGPGEFLMPTGLTLAGDALAVVDGTRLQFFDRRGALLASHPLELPCPMMLPAVSPSRTGLFIHGACMRTAYVTDTVKAVLAWSPDTASWRVIAEAPRYTRDGSMGSIFGASRLLTVGAKNVHAFGGGELNCMWRVDDSGAEPVGTEVCPAADQLYSAEPPPGLEARMRRGIAGARFRWPEFLPVYMDRFVADDVVVLLRPFSADSIVLQTARPSAIDVAVAPLNGLIGCKPAGCLWVFGDDVTTRMIVLDRAALEQRLSGMQP